MTRVAAPLFLLLLPPTALAQEGVGSDHGYRDCDAQAVTCRLTPGTEGARRAILDPLAIGAVDLSPDVDTTVLQEPSSPGCGTVALITGTVTASVGLLLAFVVESAFPWEEETSATSRYLMAGGIGFGVGAGYALVRCVHERRAERDRPLRAPRERRGDVGR